MNLLGTHIVANTLELAEFDLITEEEIISLWHNFRMSGLSAEGAWHAILTGMALDIAFARSKGLQTVVQ